MTAIEALSYLYSLHPDPHQSSLLAEPYQWPAPDVDLEVIIPCYNVGRWVCQCVDSVLVQQTSYSFFVTIVNDGSTDNTRSLLCRYEHLANVRIMDIPNQGVSVARNTGLRQAHGRYITFLDGDDIMLPGAIQSWMDRQHETDADVIQGGYRRFRTPELKTSISSSFSSVLKYFYHLFRPYPAVIQPWNGFIWGKAIRREVMQHLQFPPTYWFQDSIACWSMVPFVHSVATAHHLHVGYRITDAGISAHAHNNVKSLDSLYITMQMLIDLARVRGHHIGSFHDLLLAESADYYTQGEFDMFLWQCRADFRRPMGIDDRLSRAVFTIQSTLTTHLFSRYAPKAHPDIHALLTAHDYDGFRHWCQHH